MVLTEGNDIDIYMCLYVLTFVQHSEMVHAAYQTLQDTIVTVPSTPTVSDKQPASLMSPLWCLVSFWSICCIHCCDRSKRAISPWCRYMLVITMAVYSWYYFVKLREIFFAIQFSVFSTGLTELVNT